MDAVDSLATRLDKPLATLIVSQDEGTKRFIGEALLAGAALYLLKRYVDKYLEGIGFDEIAKQHGRTTATLLQNLRSGSVGQQDLQTAKADLQKSVTLARSKPIDGIAKSSASTVVVEMMVDAGALRGQANDEAAKVAEAAQALFGA